MATWTWLGNVACNRQGNQIAFDLVVSDLDFLPSATASLTDATKIRSIATWRRDESGVIPLSLRPIDVNEPRLLAVRIISVSGVSTECIIRVLLRFNPFNLIAINAESNQTVGGYPRVSLRGFAAGFLTLKQGATNSAVSPALDDLTLPDVFPIDITMDVEDAGVGRLPKWDQTTGTPPLNLMADAMAERVLRSDPPDDDPIVPPVAISGWSNLSKTGGNLAAASSEEPYLIVQEDQGKPQLLFENSLLRRSSNANLPSSTGCAFGADFDVTEGESSANSHIIGRWSGGSGTDDHTKWQWQIRHVFTTGSPNTHTVSARFASNSVTTLWGPTYTFPADAPPTTPTLVIYRGRTISDPPLSLPLLELWVNGVLVAIEDTLPAGSTLNTSARDLLTVGSRLDGSDALTDSLSGHIDQCFVYTSTLSDAALSLVMHEMARRADIPLGPPIPSNITQAYGPDNATAARRLQRWPVAMINLLGSSSPDNPMSQRQPWFNTNDSATEAAEFLRTEIRRALGGCQDFEIMFNRPSGQYADDFISIGVFGDVDGLSGVKVIKEYQWEALVTVYNEFGLSDRNNRDGACAPGSASYAHRAWFYTGSTAISDDGDPLQNGRSGARIVAPCSAEFYKAEYLDRWSSEDTRFRCLFVDSAVKWERKWVEVIHAVKGSYTLVGESIPGDEGGRNAAPWFSLVGISGAPWWNNFSRNQKYNPQWTAGDWGTTPIYVGITPSSSQSPGATLNLEDVNVGDGREQDNLRFEDVYRFVDKGVAPVAWGGQYAKIGAAWMYGARRIPVGRCPMLSPRISRVWR